MSSSLNPESKQFHRPVPAEMLVDPRGLIESWVAAADDWLQAFDGSRSVSPREAFEGIEHFGRLARSRLDLIEQAEGAATLNQLREILLNPTHHNAFRQALDFPDLDGWLSQAKEAWDSEQEDLQLARQLIEDLDAADWVEWYWQLTWTPESSESPQVEAYERKLTQCHLWLDRYALLFAIGEPYLRAAALTFPEETEVEDATGLLQLSMAKYARLLDACEQAWLSLEPVRAIGQLYDQPRLGSLKLDYVVPQLADAAGAQAPFIPPSLPLTWSDPLKQYQAFLFLPPHIIPGQSTIVELLFGTGDDFSQPASALVGSTVRLGQAQAVVVSAVRDGVESVVAQVSLERIVEGSEPTVSLYLNDAQWL